MHQNNDEIIIGSQIKKARNEIGMTQLELAQKVDMNVRTLRFHETGISRTMDAHKLHNIAQTLKKPMEFFIDGGDGSHSASGWVYMPETVKIRVVELIEELNKYFKKAKKRK